MLSCSVAAAQSATPPCPEAPSNGNVANAGQFAKVNGISLFYEIHGEWPPLVLIHGNGGCINGTRCQIAYFSQSRRVIVADSRSHGRSDAGSGRLTFEQIADDLSALLRELRIDASDVWGHSDGGIVALLLAIRHPDQVRKVIASSANLRPDDTALTSSFINGVRKGAATASDMIKAGDHSQDWVRRKRQLDLMLEEPHIAAADLRKITAPTLVIGADADIMPVAHTLEIFNGISSAQLFIMPGATHRMPSAEHDLYNSIVARFLDRPVAGSTEQRQVPR